MNDSRSTRHAAPTTRAATKAARRATRASVGAYHEAELASLSGHVRDGLVRYDNGEIDAFEFDELVHQYTRATQKLWGFCCGAGAHVEWAAKTLDGCASRMTCPTGGPPGNLGGVNNEQCRS